MPQNRSPNTSKVSLDTKILFIKAYVHFLMIPFLFLLMVIAISGATAYCYYNLPDKFMGQPIPDEMLTQIKTEGLKGIGGYTIIPFFVLSVLSGLITCYRNKYWYGLCALFTLGTAFVFSGYCTAALAYFRFKFVWPPQAIPELLATTPVPMPFTAEDFLSNFMKPLVLTITICMFLAVVVQLYCAFILIRLSFFYTSPKPDKPDFRSVRRAPKRKEEVVVEEEKDPEDQTGTEDVDNGKSGTGNQTGTQTDVDGDESKKSAQKAVEKA